jgi:putative DNA methylase
MVFSFHHVRPKAWLSIYQALVESQFMIIASYPVKSETSINKPNITLKEMTNIDAIIVCKKNLQPNFVQSSLFDIFVQSFDKYKEHCERFAGVGRILSKGDKYVIFSSQILVQSSLADLDKPLALKLLKKVHKFDFSQPKSTKRYKIKKPQKQESKQISLPF